MQTCQANGRRVLLSVKASSPSAVDGDVNFGDPSGAAHNASTTPSFPNLFDDRHPPTALALTLFSLFGAGKTERADLRPLGPFLNTTGITWPTRPLGEEVVLDGFDVQLPRAWQGTYQDEQFEALAERLGELEEEAWAADGDLGVEGRGVVLRGWNEDEDGEKRRRGVGRGVGRVVMVRGFGVGVE